MGGIKAIMFLNSKGPLYNHKVIFVILISIESTRSEDDLVLFFNLNYNLSAKRNFLMVSLYIVLIGASGQTS